jgi:hypothetical protein
MRFVKKNWSDVPKKKYRRLEGELKEFMAMNVKCVEMQFTENEYVNANSASTNIRRAVKRYSLPINAYMRKGKVYLVRTDMD